MSEIEEQPLPKKKEGKEEDNVYRPQGKKNMQRHSRWAKRARRRRPEQHGW